MGKSSAPRHRTLKPRIGRTFGAQLAAAALGVLLGVLVPSVAAVAAVAEYRFEASLDTGPLQGTMFPGTFSFEAGSATGVGMEFLPLSSLDFTLLGSHFSRSDIDQGGQVILENGAVSYFTAAFFRMTPAPVSDIAFGFGGPGVIGYIVPPEAFGSGRYVIFPDAVPEPPLYWLVITGLAATLFVRGMRGKRRNRRR
jgi:hypothetical protein